MGTSDTRVRTRSSGNERDASRQPARWWTWFVVAYSALSGVAILAWLVVGDAWWNQPVNLTTFWWSLPAVPAAALAAVRRYPRVTAMLAVPATLFIWAYGSLWTGSAPAAAGDLRIATYNTFVRAADVSHVVDLVRDEEPDILLLQEVFDRPAQRLRTRLDGALPFAWFGDTGQVGGVGVLSRHPIVDVRRIAKVGRFSRPTAIVVLEVHEPGGLARQIQVVPVHLTSPCPECGPSVVGRQAFEAEIRRDEMDAIIAALDPAVPAIVGGDFNSTRRSDPYRRLTAAGFRDPQVEAGAGPGFTWPGGGDGAWDVALVRIDWILARDLVPAGAWVGDARASDHRPVIADLAWTDS